MISPETKSYVQFYRLKDLGGKEALIIWAIGST